MSASTSTDQTYLVTVSVAYVTPSRSVHAAALVEVEAPAAAMALFYAESLAARDYKVPARAVTAYSATLKPEPETACGTCGERQGSEYARGCCTSDNMVEL